MILKKENKQDQIIKELAKKYNIDYRVCKAIVDSPLLYFKSLVVDDFVEHGIRIPYFGAFCQKGGYNNKSMRISRRVKILKENITNVAAMMAATLDFIVPDIEAAEDIIQRAVDDGDYEKINFIWDGWVDYNHE